VRLLLLGRYAAIVRLAAWRRSGLSPSASPLHRLVGSAAPLQLAGPREDAQCMVRTYRDRQGWWEGLELEQHSGVPGAAHPVMYVWGIKKR
jgi:hypothetical protein